LAERTPKAESASGTSREQLHRLVDELPESEIARFEQSLNDLLAERMQRTLESAPLDDEPDDDDLDGGLTEARGETPIPHEDVRRRLLGD
jgi:hypothetical protein